MQIRSNTMLMKKKASFGMSCVVHYLCKFKSIYYLQTYACSRSKKTLTSYASDSGWESKGEE